MLLQRLGDVALFTAGFFTDSFARSLVDIDYHISMGAQTYGELAERTHNSIRARALAELAENFQAMVDVLNEIAETSKTHSAADILRLYEVYARTGSLRTLKALRGLGVNPVAHGTTRIQ